METAQGPFSSLNPLEFAAAPGLPGLSTIGQLGSSMAERSALSELTTYADELNQSQALTDAIRASRTDMQAAVPAQHYVEDTRNSKWTITNTNQGFSNQGSTTAYLSSAQCVDLPTTRLTGSMRITVPGGAVAPENYFVVSNAMPLMVFTYGLQIGQNGNVLQDPGTSTDQFWLTQMRLAKKSFRKSDLVYSTTDARDGSVFTWLTNANNYAANTTVQDQTIPLAADPQSFVSTFTIRPAHSFFNIVKTWPPNIPLKLLIEWKPTLTNSLITGNGPVATALQPQVVVELRIHTLRSEEIYLEPSMRSYIMNHFETGPLTNMNNLAMARTMNKASLFDPTFGIPQFNAENIGAIFQFDVHRLSSHAISGSAFQIHPVLNGSARPKLLVIAIPHPVLPYSGTLTPNPAGGCTLQTLQVLYNGQTVWDEPYSQVTDVANNMLPLYAESARYANADKGIGPVGKDWFNYNAWAADRGWIIINMAPSHNENEIQPNSSAPIEIRGSFTTAVPQGLNIRVGLFFDQTMLLQKNNTAIFSLPIY